MQSGKAVEMVHRHCLRVFLPCLVALGLGLSGCDQVRKSLGYAKNPPDEFAVRSRAPLSVPPDFQVRPPAPGAERPQEPSRRDEARSLITGQQAPGDTGSEAGALRGLLALDTADPEIRERLNREGGVFVYEDETFVDRLLFWNDRTPEASVIDPVKERERLQRNAAAGRPATEGETPTIERRKEGLLNRLF